MAGTVIVLLRGINVGGAKRIPMAALKGLVESLGYTEVRTLLNSGNVVFRASRGTPAQAAAKIQAAIAASLGLDVPVIALDAAELSRIVAANPFQRVADNPSRLFVELLSDAKDLVKVAEILRRDWGREKIAKVDERAVYLWLPAGSIDSPLEKAFSGALKPGVTARNIATMTKLAALAGGA